MGIFQVSRVKRLLATVVTLAVLFTGISSTIGASGNRGTISGSLRIFGGPSSAPRSGSPTAGRVEFKPEHGTARAIKVGNTGQFSVELKPGIYTVFGGPPGWRNTCKVNFGKPFSLGAGQRLKVTVSCIAL